MFFFIMIINFLMISLIVVRDSCILIMKEYIIFIYRV